MDLAVYIGELLRQRGVLSVPGLGKFAQVRMHGYYDEDQGVFYPPHYETSFTETDADDATLAQYISSIKSISVTSSDFFIDKYVSNVRKQAAKEVVQLDQLGWMSLQGKSLQFKPNANTNTYEQEYFGLPSLSVNKIWEQLSGYRRPAEPAPASQPAVSAGAASAPVTAAKPATVTPPATPELAIFPEVINLKNDTAEPARSATQGTRTGTARPAEEKAKINFWILLAIIVVVAAIILLALYKYKPAFFGNTAVLNYSVESYYAAISSTVKHINR